VPSGEASLYASPLFAVAGILGSLSTILFAIIVFGLQVYARRLGGSHFLVRYVARHEGLIPLASLVLGVVGANLVLGLLAGVGLAAQAKMLALMAIALAPLLLFVALWLLHRILITATGDVQREGLLPVLRWEYARALDENDRTNRL